MATAESATVARLKRMEVQRLVGIASSRCSGSWVPAATARVMATTPRPKWKGP